MNDYARYTLTLDDAIDYDPNILDVLTLSTTARTEKFQNIFKAVYGLREIGGETTAQFKSFLAHTITQHQDTYEKLLDIYEDEQLDWKDGDVTTTTYDDDITQTYGRKNESAGHSQANTLPNKVVSQPTKYATSTSDDTTSSQDSGQDTTMHRGDLVTKNGNKIKLRKEYADDIRNIYLEFCDKFASCFVGLLD